MTNPVWNGWTVDLTQLVGTNGYGYGQIPPVPYPSAPTLPFLYASMQAAIDQCGVSVATAAAGFTGTSTTSASIGAGAHTLTVQTGKGFATGQIATAYQTSNPRNRMTGPVSGYNTATGDISFTVGATDYQGFGTITDWTVALSGVTGLPGTTGIGMAFDTATGSGPAAGALRLNNATENTATAIYVSDTDTNGVDVTNVIATFDASSSTVKGYVFLRSVVDPTKLLVFQVNSRTAGAGFQTIGVTIVSSSGASPFVNGEALALEFIRTGDIGSTGPTGPAGSAAIPDFLILAYGVQ